MTIVERVFLVTSIMSWCGLFKSIGGQEGGLEVGLFLVAVSSSIIFCFV
jgi:hypothetical protein